MIWRRLFFVVLMEGHGMPAAAEALRDEADVGPGQSGSEAANFSTIGLSVAAQVP